MAIGDAYATAANYRAAITKTDTAEDAEVLEHLTAISRVIDRHLGRYFTKDVSAVARTYYVGDGDCTLGESHRELWVPDIATATGLAVKRDDDDDGSFADETAWTIDVDFELSPANALLGPEAEPFTKLVIPRHSSKSAFAQGERIQITAVTGWPSVPKAIERACIDLTAILRLESPRATSRVPETADAEVSMSKEAQALITRLMSSYGRAAASVFS